MLPPYKPGGKYRRMIDDVKYTVDIRYAPADNKDERTPSGFTWFKEHDGDNRKCETVDDMLQVH
jgi:hypothetical protein